jgi:hypothetical protein
VWRSVRGVTAEARERDRVPSVGRPPGRRTARKCYVFGIFRFRASLRCWSSVQGAGNVGTSNARERHSLKSCRSRCRLPGKRTELANSCGSSVMPVAAESTKGCGLRIPISDSAVLRQLKSHVCERRETEPLRAIAIDDWSWGKGRHLRNHYR